RLEIAVWVSIVVGNFAALILYDFYRSAPLLSANIALGRADLVQYSAGRGKLFILQNLLVVAVPLSYYLYRTSTSHKLWVFAKFLAQTMLCLIPLSLYGGRFYILAPLILTVLTHSVFIRRIPIRVLAVGGITILSAAMMFAFLRFIRSDALTRSFSDTLATEFFPEMRFFELTAKVLGPVNLYREMILGLLASLLPSSLLLFLGADKQDLLFAIGSYVARALNSADPIGIRIGLLGESYLGYGYVGVSFLYLVIGMALQYLDNKFDDMPAGDGRLYTIITISLYVSLAVMYGTGGLISTFFATLFVYFIVRFSTWKEPIDDEGQGSLRDDFLQSSN
ncbi:MAG TPA: hypothetical protein VL334_07520, partial [Anaerolineae bacterium]|nr:hypothetical protein [Anaerolineae bacterium]